MVITSSEAWINRGSKVANPGRAVSETGTMHVFFLSPFAPENLVSRNAGSAVSRPASDNVVCSSSQCIAVLVIHSNYRGCLLYFVYRVLIYIMYIIVCIYEGGCFPLIPSPSS